LTSALRPSWCARTQWTSTYAQPLRYGGETYI